MGREFIDLFDKWAHSYDESVAGHDPEYRAVFDKYDSILTKVTEHTVGNVLEFGVGTGNLSKKLLSAGHFVVGIEPSKAMRRESNAKFPELRIEDGDFLSFPPIKEEIQSIVSTFAFHHLTDEEKERAIKGFANLLPSGGKVIFADTVFENDEAKEKAIQLAKANGFKNLLYDLTTEYYPTISVLQKLFETNGFYVTFKQMNDFAWLLVAEKSA